MPLTLNQPQISHLNNYHQPLLSTIIINYYLNSQNCLALTIFVITQYHQAYSSTTIVSLFALITWLVKDGQTLLIFSYVNYQCSTLIVN